MIEIEKQGRKASLLVHIAFHFVPHRWQYLERVLTGLSEFELDRVQVVVDSNTSDVLHRIASLPLPRHCQVRVDVHPTLTHPFDLTWAHRKHMANSLALFDYFMYLEDDIYVPWRTFDAWLRRSDSVSRMGFIHGFLRVETDHAGLPRSTDWRRPIRCPAIFEIDSVKYIRPEAFYQACWIYSRSTMQRFVAMDAWTRGFHKWSSVTRGHRHLGGLNLTREFSAFGMACATPGRPRIVLPLDDQGRVPSDAWVWHLPNNYAQGSDLDLLDARELIRGKLRSHRPFGLDDRALEATRWTTHLLHLNEGAQLVRSTAKRLLRRCAAKR
jgi:hypothetical protein